MGELVPFFRFKKGDRVRVVALLIAGTTLAHGQKLFTIPSKNNLFGLLYRILQQCAALVESFIFPFDT